MNDLIERMEKATGPSVSLNRAIWSALNPDQDPTTYNGDPRWKPYTSSIDAVLTLVPQGCYAEGPAGPAIVNKCMWEIWQVGGDKAGKVSEGFGATPILALCIAALKYHAALNIQQRTGD